MADKIRVLLPEEDVNKRISEVAEQISKDYEGKQIHLICILKGGVFFTCELAKRITVPVTMDCLFPATETTPSPAEWSASLRIWMNPWRTRRS